MTKRKHHPHQHHYRDNSDAARDEITTADTLEGDDALKFSNIDDETTLRTAIAPSFETPVKRKTWTRRSTPTMTTTTPDSIDSQLLPSTADVEDLIPLTMSSSLQLLPMNGNTGMINDDDVVHNNEEDDHVDDDATTCGGSSCSSSPAAQSVATEQLPTTEEMNALFVFPSSSSVMSPSMLEHAPHTTIVVTNQRDSENSSTRHQNHYVNNHGNESKLEDNKEEPIINMAVLPVTPPTPTLPRYYILCDVIPWSWLPVLEQWQSDGTCVILESLGRSISSLASSSSSSSPSLPRNLIYMPHCYEMPHPFQRQPNKNKNKNNDQSTVLVCHRTWNYLLAKALGIPVVCPANGNLHEWIKTLDHGQRGSNSNDDDEVWGDATLYQQVQSVIMAPPQQESKQQPPLRISNTGSSIVSNYSWLQSQEWWGIQEHNKSVLPSSPWRRRQAQLLHEYSICLATTWNHKNNNHASRQEMNRSRETAGGLGIVPQEYNDVDGTINTTPKVQTNNHQVDDALSNHPEMFHSVSMDEMAQLCQLAGAHDVVVEKQDVARLAKHGQQQQQQRRVLLTNHIVARSHAEWAEDYQRSFHRRGDHVGRMIFRPMDEGESSVMGDGNKSSNMNNKEERSIFSFLHEPQHCKQAGWMTVVAVVRYTWVLDSICANAVAPLHSYCIGLLLPEQELRSGLDG